jgi:putative transposase
MPARITPLITGQFYHIFNRGINKQPIFLGTKDYNHALEAFKFYSFVSPTKLRFSKFLFLSEKERIKFWERLERENRKLIEMITFSLMPNHFHFLLEQKTDNGISKFMATFQNSYTRYFNTRHKKIDPILQGQFKAVRVEDENQLLHLSRYIHLNPYSSFVTKTLSELENYPWSSLPEYLGKIKKKICSKEIILSNFRSQKEYQKFVFDQADYQRRLEEIRHLTLE